MRNSLFNIHNIYSKCLVLVTVCIIASSAGGRASNAQALPTTSDACGTCSCTLTQAIATINYIEQQHDRTRLFITEQFKIHEDWVFGSNRNFGGAHDSFFELHMLPALMMMTEQLVTVGMEQMFILGTFFDAKIQLETQRLFQEKAAEAHRDYHPATGMCVIGTTARGLASADHNSEFTKFVMSQRSQDRQLGIYSQSAAHSAGIDREGRIRQVKERYCDMDDNSGDMEELCESGDADPATVNKDIDYTRTVDLPRTLNIDFTDGNASGDEQDVLALGSNLFSYEVLNKPEKGPGALEAAEGDYMALRSIVAKRSVAENSFNSIVGLKAAGTEASEQTIPFTEKVLEQFGITDQNERRLLIGGTQDDGVTAALRPSYYAQMEVLAQKIYQDPEFYSNLYDKPANVARKQVAMQAINLMLERDMYKNEQRSEMVMSIWLEMELLKYQKDIQNRLNAMNEEYEQN